MYSINVTNNHMYIFGKFVFYFCTFVAQLLSNVQLSVTLWTAAHQDSQSFTISQSLLRFMSIEVVMPSNHLVLCHPLLPSIFPSIRVFSNESALCIRGSWGFSFSISPSNLMHHMKQGHPLRHHMCGEGSQRGPTEPPLLMGKPLWAHLANGQRKSQG